MPLRPEIMQTLKKVYKLSTRKQWQVKELNESVLYEVAGSQIEHRIACLWLMNQDHTFLPKLRGCVWCYQDWWRRLRWNGFDQQHV